jgi:hydroxypyruvate reductase
MRSLEAAAQVFQESNIRPVILGDSITGEARDVGREMAALARRTKGPAALISGGECTVTIRGEGGRGGRCSEFLLALGLENPDVWAIAADTDGIDGSQDNAGAVWSPAYRGRAGAQSFLDRNDSYGFFAEAGGLVVTGPTRTNVNDYRAIVVA